MKSIFGNFGENKVLEISQAGNYEKFENHWIFRSD
jgi:hypothetical protein